MRYEEGIGGGEHFYNSYVQEVPSFRRGAEWQPHRDLHIFFVTAPTGRDRKGGREKNNGKMRIVSQHDKDKKVVDIIG